MPESSPRRTLSCGLLIVTLCAHNSFLINRETSFSIRDSKSSIVSPSFDVDDFSAIADADETPEESDSPNDATDAEDASPRAPSWGADPGRVPSGGAVPGLDEFVPVGSPLLAGADAFHE